MDQPKMERLLRLMKLLIGNNQYSVDDIAEKLDTSPRSIYRYIDTFKGAGFVVQKKGDVFRLSQESKCFKEISQLIHFTEEEAYIVNRLIDSLDNNNLLKQNLRKKLISVYDCTSLADCIVKGKNAGNVHCLIEAIENRRQAVLKDYASSHSKNIRDRFVEPFAFTTNYMEVWCYDIEADCNKLFKTERIGSVLVKDEPWAHADCHESDIIDVFRISSMEQHHVKFRLGIRAHNVLLEEYPLAERDLMKISENEWILDTKVCDFRGVTRFVLGMADDITIIESEEFKEYLRNFVKKNLSNI